MTPRRALELAAMALMLLVPVALIVTLILAFPNVHPPVYYT